MNSHRLAIVAFAALLAAGCRTRPEERAMFEAYQEEARQQEQRLYELLYQNQILHDENSRLKKRLALGRTDRVDDGPTIVPSRPPRRDDPPASDDIELVPPEIDTGPANPRPAPGGTRKPVTPEESDPPDEPAEKPPEEALPDVDAPPGERSPKPEDDPPDEPPPRPASILKPRASGRAPPSEILPAPRPGRKPKTPELLPAPEEKKVSRLSFQWQGEPSGDSGGQQRWSPRPAQRGRRVE